MDVHICRGSLTAAINRMSQQAQQPSEIIQESFNTSAGVCEKNSSFGTTMKHIVFTAPSYVATFLINVPLILIMIWVLGWVFRLLHKVLMSGIDRILVGSPRQFIQYVVSHRLSLYAAILFFCLLVSSLLVESYRVGGREAVGTAVRGAVFVANLIYKAFRLIAEIVWIVIGLVFMLFQREGPREFLAKAWDGIKESLTETR